MRLVILAFILPLNVALAQLSGQVIDSKTRKPIVGAEVFINRSQIKTLTDKNGYFVIEGLQVGTFTVGCYLKGYKTSLKTISIKAGENVLYFGLEKEMGKVLKDQQLKSDILSSLLYKHNLLPTWYDQCLLAKSNLMNEGPDSGTNVYGSLDFENRALGYKIKCHLLGFKNNSPEYALQFYPIKGDENEQKVWDDNRFLAYQFTVNNFLESLLLNALTPNKYTVLNNSNTPISLDNQLLMGNSGEKNHLLLNQKILIRHTINELTYESWLEAEDKISFTDEGMILNPDSVTLGGIYSENNITILLPREYTPSLNKKEFKLNEYFEKAYLHTDKPYYFPGDTLWFKAYMNYETPFLIESLSKVLYVDLLSKNNGGQIIASRILKIDDGEAWGEFLLPDMLTSDYLALRAYTNWQRNYTDPQIFQKFFPLIKRSQNILNARNEIKTNERVIINFDKKTYTLRDNVQFSVSVVNGQNSLVSAWMSVSVTDRSMVRLLNDSITIDSAFSIRPMQETTKLVFPIEKGINLGGQYVNARNKASMVTLTLISNGFQQAFEFDTDIYGKFAITGLDLPASAIVQWKAKEGKYILEGGKIIPEEKSKLSINFEWPETYTSVERADFKIDKNTTLLNEVIIQGRRLADEQKKSAEKPIFRPYGAPQYFVNVDQSVTYVNLIEMLRGKVPGLTITSSGSDYQMRFNRAASLTGSTTPAVIIDDRPSAGSATQTLLTINPNDVAAIEVTARLVPMLGDLGANGVIFVYTKSGGLRGKFEDATELNTLKINGYSPSANFYGINHKKSFIPPNSDFRTTLFWDPVVISSVRNGNDIVSFYASDSTGPYLITIEGVTVEGKPFRTEQLIEIKEE